jgi:diguanylate cyclase (GGDEF)-like protein
VHKQFVKSSCILVAVAVVWAAGIVLLLITYVRPTLARQAESIDENAATEWLRLANSAVRTRRGQMLRVTAQWATWGGLARHLAPGAAAAPDGAMLHEPQRAVGTVLLCGPDRRVVSAWRRGLDGALVSDAGFRPGLDLGATAVFQVKSGAANASGVGKVAGRPALFARSHVLAPGLSRPIGYVVGITSVDSALAGELSTLVGVRVSFDKSVYLPPDKRLPTFGVAAWREGGQSVKAAQVFRDSSGAAMGHLVVQGDAPSATRSMRAFERALTLTLVWAVGFAMLMMVVVHVLVSLPTGRLLRRIRRLRGGQTVEDLSADLRGEALALASEFDEVLGQVEQVSRTDALTGLHNRRAFQRVFNEEFRRARRYNRPMALVIMDVDFFKAANDAFGHQAGDELLQVYASVIVSSVRNTDTVARLGGDEFAILMPETSGEMATPVVERVRRRLAEQAVGRGDLKMSLTVSVGIVDMTSLGAENPGAFFNLADQALYAAKRRGRNRVIRAEDIEGGEENDSGRVDREKVDDLCEQLARLDAKFKRLFVDAIGGLISALEARDSHTANHSGKVRRYSVMIAEQMNLPERSTEHIARAAMLHDIGKIGLPDKVLLKEGDLDDEEWRLVRSHPVMSVRIMEGMAFLDQEIPAVRYHHERFDGGGYPEGLCGSAIPLPARILAVADAFDAMTSTRVYRDGKSVAHAMEELRRGSGAQFDPTVVQAFLDAIEAEEVTDESLHGAPSPSA